MLNGEKAAKVFKICIIELKRKCVFEFTQNISKRAYVRILTVTITGKGMEWG
jgi:hypothetical protein